MIKKDIECAHCKILINTNNPDLNYRYDGHTYLCDSCFDTDYCVCDFCWKFVKVGEQTNINDHIHGDLHMCKECREEVTIICFCCNKVIKYEEAIFYRKQNFCQECMNNINKLNNYLYALTSMKNYISNNMVDLTNPDNLKTWLRVTEDKIRMLEINL